jgi:hypothetical protein
MYFLEKNARDLDHQTPQTLSGIMGWPALQAKA